MNTNTESRYELATPITFGMALGFLISPLGSPAAAIAAFTVGAGLGFWFDQKPNKPITSKDEAPLEGSAKKTICH